MFSGAAQTISEDRKEVRQVLERPAGSLIAVQPKQRSLGLASIFKIRELNVLLALLIVGALISLVRILA
jgi:hypothetical protein